MAITFDTLEYVNELKAADVPAKQAEAQAKALRHVLDMTLEEQAQTQQASSAHRLEQLGSKTEKAILQLDAKIEIMRRDIINKLGTMVIGTGVILIAALGVAVAFLKG